MATVTHLLLVVSLCLGWEAHGLNGTVATVLDKEDESAAKPHHAHAVKALHHAVVHQPHASLVPHMLNHGSVSHTVTQDHKVHMLNHKPKAKPTTAGKITAASSSMPVAGSLDDLDEEMTNFMWTKSAVSGIGDTWLPNVGHNTRIFRAELCAERQLDSKHYDDCYAFMTKFCQRNDNLWDAVSKVWAATVQEFCDRFWAIKAPEDGTTTKRTTRRTTSTEAPLIPTFAPMEHHVEEIDQEWVHTTRAPPVRQPTRVVKPERSEVAIAEICAKEAKRGLGRTATRHCHEFMDKQCDTRVTHGSGMTEHLRRACHDFYASEADAAEDDYSTSSGSGPGPAPAPGPEVWPPVDNQKKEEWDMPEQGYSGPPVHYDHGKTMTGDWQEEFGPKAKGFQSVRSICMDHQESEWCRLSGYHTPVHSNVDENMFPTVHEPSSSSQQLGLAMVLLAIAAVVAVVLRKSSGG